MHAIAEVDVEGHGGCERTFTARRELEPGLRKASKIAREIGTNEGVSRGIFVARPRGMLSSLRLAIPALLLVGAVGCHHHRPHVEQVRGPDGHSWKLAECEHMDRRCYDIAQRSCPNGFYMAKNPVEARSSVEERRESNAQTDNAVSVSPKRGGGNVTTLPPQNKWGSDMYSRRSGRLLFRCADGQDPHSEG